MRSFAGVDDFCLHILVCSIFCSRPLIVTNRERKACTFPPTAIFHNYACKKNLWMRKRGRWVGKLLFTEEATNHHHSSSRVTGTKRSWHPPYLGHLPTHPSPPPSLTLPLPWPSTSTGALRAPLTSYMPAGHSHGFTTRAARGSTRTICHLAGFPTSYLLLPTSYLLLPTPICDTGGGSSYPGPVGRGRGEYPPPIP